MKARCCYCGRTLHVDGYTAEAEARLKELGWRSAVVDRVRVRYCPPCAKPRFGPFG